MKVINQGTDPLNAPKLTTCRNCRSMVEFTPREVTTVSDQREGDYYSFACPVCAANVTHSVRA